MWDCRTYGDATPLDGRVAQVRVVDPRHPLYGNCFPVIDRRSGRGPRLIVIELPDGRERSISRSATDLATTADDRPAAPSRQAHISVRALLPLANHVRAVLASRNADLEGGGRHPCQTLAGPEQNGVGRITGSATAPLVAASGRDTTPAGAAYGAARATPTAAVRRVRGETPC
jgi:hypothetical protein